MECELFDVPKQFNAHNRSHQRNSSEIFPRYIKNKTDQNAIEHTLE
jgi:hypothetical protein